MKTYQVWTAKDPARVKVSAPSAIDAAYVMALRHDLTIGSCRVSGNELVTQAKGSGTTDNIHVEMFDLGPDIRTISYPAPM